MAATEAAALNETSLTLHRRLHAPLEDVWRAWTEADALAHWFGPRNIERVEAEIELKVGGRYRFLMHATDGETHDVGGHYREVVRPHRLVFTWAWASTPDRESLVSVDLRADGDATLLTLTHERFADREATEGHAEGWAGSMDKLAEVLQPGTPTRNP